uniref:Si:ch211-248a14.8 n=1 Tax=Cyprinus carpio TaxID=7962 RepID=A0A8C1US15_CYPCA
MQTFLQFTLCFRFVKLPLASLLPSLQVFLNLLALLALHSVGLIHLKPFSLRLGERLFVPAVCGSIQCILAIWAEAYSHSGLYLLIARFLPMVSLCLGHLFALSMPGSIHSLIAFLFSAYKGLHAIEPLEYVYSPLNLVLHSLSLAWLAKVSQTERGHASTFDLYYTLTVTRTLLLGFLCVLHPDGPKALMHGNWNSLLFMGYMLGMLLLGAVQLLFVDVTALYFSALPAAMLHATRGLSVDHSEEEPFISIKTKFIGMTTSC